LSTEKRPSVALTTPQDGQHTLDFSQAPEPEQHEETLPPATTENLSAFPEPDEDAPF
jgi:hypothetical protein